MSTPATTPAARVLRFDAFELDLHAGELRKRGVRLRLQGQPIQVLGILLQCPGSLVTREELTSQLWPADTFVDFDHSLHNAIGRIREVLGDSAETPRYIETLPRRGYRFIGQVEGFQAPLIAAENGNKKDETVAVARRPALRRALILTLCAGLAIALAAWAVRQRVYGKSTALPIRSIAVLPLQNLSGDAAQEYFADGMTDQLITEMSRIQPLRVISRTSVMEYKGTKKHLPQIAHELGVDGIVEGSVVREGDQIRVTVQLLDAPNDRHIWSENYQRPLRGILNLQREVAQAIAQQIRIELTPRQQARVSSARAVDPEAYEDYLRGRFYLTTGFSMRQPLDASKKYFEEAIRRDPGFAMAYGGLADSYSYLAFFHHLSPQSAFPAASEAVRKALDLDDSLGSSHTTLALLDWRYDWDLAAAQREFDYAIAQAPSDGCAHASYAEYLGFTGRRAEALAEVNKGRELDPSSSFSTTESAVYYLLRDYDGLIESSRRGLASDPNEWIEHYSLGLGYEGSGKAAEAIPEYQKAVEMSDSDQEPTVSLAHAYAVTGKRVEAEKILGDLQRKSKERYVSPYLIATIYAGLGDKDRAFEFLEKAYEERSLDMSWNLKADLRIDNLRSDPRFEGLWRRVGFPQ